MNLPKECVHLSISLLDAIPGLTSWPKRAKKRGDGVIGAFYFYHHSPCCEDYGLICLTWSFDQKFHFQQPATTPPPPPPPHRHRSILTVHVLLAWPLYPLDLGWTWTGSTWSTTRAHPCQPCSDTIVQSCHRWSWFHNQWTMIVKEVI